MKFLDKVTRYTLETDNEEVIEQYKKHSDRYTQVDDSDSIFTNMSDEELAKYADENNIDISKAKTRDAIIKLLEK